MKQELQEWLKSFIIWLGTLLMQLGYWLGEVGRKLVAISPTLDAIARLLMVLILLAYTLKVWFGVQLPILAPIGKKIGKWLGLKNKQVKTVGYIDDDFASVEDTVIKTKTMSITLWTILKKGCELMRKIIVAIGRFFYRNKFTLLGALSLVIIATSVYFRIAKPEVVANFIGDKELFGGLLGLFSYSMFALFGYGIEDQEAWNRRRANKEAEKKIRREQEERLRQELRQNKLIKTISKEIEKNIVPTLKERLRQEVIYGKDKAYRSLTDLFPDLNFEFIKAELGNDEVKIEEFLNSIDELAKKYGLLEEITVTKIVNGVKQEVKEYVNLILEEIQK